MYSYDQDEQQTNNNEVSEEAANVYNYKQEETTNPSISQSDIM